MRYGLLLVLLTATLAPVALAQPLAHRADPPGTATASASSPAPAPPAATAEVPFADLPVYYVVDRRPELRAGAGTGAVLGRLDFRRGVRVRAEHGPWRQVEDVETGQRLGWVEATALSNVWVLMDKPSRTLYVYRGSDLLRSFPADVSHNP
jgi:hypothetical protein